MPPVTGNKKDPHRCMNVPLGAGGRRALTHRPTEGQSVRNRGKVSAIVLREDWFAMPRQRTHHSRRTYDFPDDFPQRLVRFKEESDLPWAEIARRPSPPGPASRDVGEPPAAHSFV